jgi:hypothetical protein
MSLITFHRLLIGVAIVFCGGYALWELVRFFTAGNTRSLLLAAIFAVLAFGLVYYLRHLGRFLGLPRDDSTST